MRDLFLKFDSKEQADEILFPDGAQTLRNVVVLGTIMKTVGVAADGEEIREALPGWHVNVRALDGEDITLLEDFEVFPETPEMVWA